MTSFLKSTAAAGLNGETGKKAIKAEFRNLISAGDETSFTGSVDLDSHFEDTEPNANRWDYGIGFEYGHEFALWIEPHPASGSGEVAIMLRKLEWLRAKLRSSGYEGLAALTKAAEKKGEIPFRWLYKGKTSFRAGGKEARQLAQNGMKLPERSIRVG